MDTFSTVVVSNRLPMSVSKVDGKLHYSPSSGGLATAMASLEADNKIWIGWPGIDSDDLSDHERTEITTELQKHGCYPVFLTRQQTADYYEGYANDTIWPLFHYFQTVARYDDRYWDAYREVNQLFADAIKQVALPTASIWIQDYHLMNLPQLTREVLPNASIGFFLHIPFPSFEIYRLLPERKEILRGLLGADLIGFHIYDYSRYFLGSCQRLLGVAAHGDIIEHDGRAVRVGIFPIGIDYAKFRAQLDSTETKTAIKLLDESYHDQKLILSVDRLDYSKGIDKRLKAFALLLEEHPEYIGKVKLQMVAVPSRIEVDAYKNLRDEIEKIVSRINGTFGTAHWAPISYQFQNRPFAEIVALYARADVALVTPIRDGMNLVAKEYIASKKRQGGVLILSEMAGAIDELPESLSVNPNDTRSVLDALLKALVMPKRDQMVRIEAMQNRLRASTVQDWGRSFMNELSNSSDSLDLRFKKRITADDRREILENSRAAKSRLLLLDYDGTLRSFVKSPLSKAAAPSLKARRVLKSLTDLPDTKVAIISGRPRNALASWFGRSKLDLAAEHGAWTRYNGHWEHTKNEFSAVKKRVYKLMQGYTERTEGSLIEEKEYGMVWHYIKVEPDLAYKRARELQHDLRAELDEDKFSIAIGQNIVEVIQRNVSKANAVKKFVEHYPAEFVICIGDDYTDEDMFAALEDSSAVTIKVGSGKTHAKYQLENVPAVLNLLDELTPSSFHTLTELPTKLKSGGLFKKVRSKFFKSR